MYCSQCGREIPGEGRYCPACGARQEAELVPAEEAYFVERTEEEKRRRAHRRGRRLGNFLVSVIALVILFVGNDEVPDASDYVYRRTDVSCFTVQNQREMAICDAKGNTCMVDLPQKLLYSGDQNRAAYIDRDKELYQIEDLSPVFVDDKVKDADLSFYGDALVYVSEGEGSGDELCLYDLGTGNCERLKITSCMDFRVSPDGKSAAYVETDGALSFWSPGHQETRISGNVSRILALTDGGEQILYQKNSGQLFTYQEGREQKLASVSGTVDSILNESQTEILYTDNGAAWYYSADMEEPVRLTGVKGALLTSDYMEGTAYQQRQGLILGRKTLKDMTFATCDPADQSYKIYRLDRTGRRAERILNHAEQFRISEDGRSLLYLADQKLYRLKDVQSAADRECLSGTLAVRQFASDPKLRKIWFVTSEQELYYVQDKTYVPLAYEVSRLYGSCMGRVLFQEGQDLYCAEGAEAVLVKADVREAWIKGDRYVVADTDRELCYLKDLKEEVPLLGSR